MTTISTATITFGSLFSGIGAMDLGLERAGMVCKWQCEIDGYCRNVLRRHWPGVPILKDVRNVLASTVEAVDLICGGFPCPPVSLAGRREGKNDTRWLWPEFYRVVDDLRPSIVLLENVPGILSLCGVEVSADLATLGYDAEWDCISASSVGAWHKRDRWFCVAYATSERLAIGEVFGENARKEREAFMRSNREKNGCFEWKLSAEFVEQLQGLPAGWTDLEH